MIARALIIMRNQLSDSPVKAEVVSQRDAPDRCGSLGYSTPPVTDGGFGASTCKITENV